MPPADAPSPTTAAGSLGLRRFFAPLRALSPVASEAAGSNRSALAADDCSGDSGINVTQSFAERHCRAAYYTRRQKFLSEKVFLGGKGRPALLVSSGRTKLSPGPDCAGDQEKRIRLGPAVEIAPEKLCAGAND